jgi:twitching motility protein PilT
VALEIMVITPTIQEDIRDPARTDGIKDAIEKGRQQYGMQSFDQHLTDLYRANIITLQTAVQGATNPSDFERALHRGARRPLPGPRRRAAVGSDLRTAASPAS